MKANHSPLILLVDENPFSAKRIKQLLQIANPNAIVTYFGNTSRVLDTIKHSEVSLLITELQFGDGYSGHNLIEDVRSQKKGKKLPIFVWTEKESHEIPRRALLDLDVQIFLKPADETQVVESVSNLLNMASVTSGATQRIYLERDDFLFHEGDGGDNLFILIEGKLNALKEKSGKMKLVGEITAGQLFGEMSLIDGAPRSVSIQAAEESLVFELHSEEMRSYLQRQPAWLKILIESMLGRIRSLNKTLAES